MADHFPELSEWFTYENKLGETHDKTIIWTLLSQNIVICQCLADKLFAVVDNFSLRLRQISGQLVTDRARYFAHPRPIILNNYGRCIFSSFPLTGGLRHLLWLCSPVLGRRLLQVSMLVWVLSVASAVSWAAVVSSELSPQFWLILQWRPSQSPPTKDALYDNLALAPDLLDGPQCATTNNGLPIWRLTVKILHFWRWTIKFLAIWRLTVNSIGIL